MTIHNRKLKDVTLTQVKTKYGGIKHLLCLVYEEEDDFGNIHEVTLKNILLPLRDDFRITETHCDLGEPSLVTIDVGYGGILLRDPHTNITDTIVKYAPPKEMTLEEIEKKLGHKVKIVSGEEKS